VSTLRRQALQWLLCTDPGAKASGVRGIEALGPSGAAEALAEAPGIPGRPARPLLVPHTRLKSRSVHSLDGRAALLHSLAHIELNAIEISFTSDIPYCEIHMKPRPHAQLCCPEVSPLRGAASPWRSPRR